MISICIPIYNLDVTSLVKSLALQAQKLSCNIEIVMIDDGSDEKFKKINEGICKKSGTYIELTQNIGRAKIRNRFLQYTRYEYLLFMDCDSIILADNFLQNYVLALQVGTPLVICGGRIYSEQKAERHKRLNWKYGIKKESQPVEVRQKNPNKSFMTNNFIIHRNILDEIRFDEQITQYGHEDTLFGFQLKKRSIKIQHINNPVMHGDLEENSVFLRKTEQGIINLLHIVQTLNYDPEFIKDVTLLNFYEKLKSKKQERICGFIFQFLQPLLKKIISTGYANLYLLDFYKIGFLCISKHNHL